jgi:hypothetical protein
MSRRRIASAGLALYGLGRSAGGSAGKRLRRAFFCILHSLFVICRRLALHKADSTGWTGRETVAKPVAIVLPKELSLAVHHSDSSLVAGLGAQTAAVALFLIYLNYFSDHKYTLSAFYALIIMQIGVDFCCICNVLRFLYPLAANILRTETQKICRFGKGRNLTLDIGLVIGELSAEGGADVLDSIKVIDNINSAENHHASDGQLPIALGANAVLTQAKANLIAWRNGVEALTAGSPAMEINATVGLIIIMVHRSGIRVAALTVNTQYAPSLIF